MCARRVIAPPTVTRTLLASPHGQPACAPLPSVTAVTAVNEAPTPRVSGILPRQLTYASTNGQVYDRLQSLGGEQCGPDRGRVVAELSGHDLGR